MSYKRQQKTANVKPAWLERNEQKSGEPSTRPEPPKEKVPHIGPRHVLIETKRNEPPER